MKPMKVTAGEHAPDLDELLEKARAWMICSLRLQI